MLSGRHQAVRDERGMTLIELLVSIFVLAVGILGAVTVLAQGDRLSGTSQQREAAIGFAEQQLENVRQTPFASLGMNASPSASTDPNNPNHYVDQANAPCSSAATGYDIETNYQSGGAPTTCEPFVTGGGVQAGSQPISGYSGLTGTWYAYVTSRPEPCLSLNGVITVNCLSNTKRITVAVWPSSQNRGTRKPVWVSSVVSDPNTQPLALP